MPHATLPAGRPRWEIAGAVLMLSCFFLINALVATRTPTVFTDEVEYTDPAANLYFGDGFTSTMWAQDRHEFWCGNVPLFQGVLFAVFKMFGFGLFQARLTGIVLAALGSGLIWAALRWNGLVTSPGGRLLALALISSGSVSTLTFRTVRYDALMFCVCALVFFACSLPALPLWRRSGALLFSVFLPCAGIPMLPYAALLGAILLFFYRTLLLDRLLSIAAGCASGVAALVAFYRHFDAWRQFVAIVLPFTGLGEEQHRTLGKLIFGESLGSESLLTSFFGNPLEFLDQRTLFDYSAFLLFVVLAVLAARTWRFAGAEDRRFMLLILAITLIVPPAMHVAGHYRSFYRWMTYIPLAIAVPRLLEIASRLDNTGWLRRCALSVAGLSFFLGIPLRTAAILPQWSKRSPAPMERIAARVVKSSDVVVCNYRAYFAVRPMARLTFALELPARGEFSRIKDFPTNEVSLLCLLPDEENPIGLHWMKLPMGNDPDAIALARGRYPIQFYRRETNSTP